MPRRTRQQEFLDAARAVAQRLSSEPGLTYDVRSFARLSQGWSFAPGAFSGEKFWQWPTSLFYLSRKQACNAALKSQSRPKNRNRKRKTREEHLQANAPQIDTGGDGKRDEITDHHLLYKGIMRDSALHKALWVYDCLLSSRAGHKQGAFYQRDSIFWLAPLPRHPDFAKLFGIALHSPQHVHDPDHQLPEPLRRYYQVMMDIINGITEDPRFNAFIEKYAKHYDDLLPILSDDKIRSKKASAYLADLLRLESPRIADATTDVVFFELLEQKLRQVHDLRCMLCKPLSEGGAVLYQDDPRYTAPPVSKEDADPARSEMAGFSVSKTEVRAREKLFGEMFRFKNDPTHQGWLKFLDFAFSFPKMWREMCDEVILGKEGKLGAVQIVREFQEKALAQLGLSHSQFWQILPNRPRLRYGSPIMLCAAAAE